MKYDVMLDLETFATSPDACILQVGACFFDRYTDQIGKRFYTNVSLATSVLAGLKIDPETVQWWRDRDYSHLLHEAKPLSKMTTDFSRWFLADYMKEDIRIWSHGAAFDIPILQSSYLALGQEVPWHYRAVRDTRTIFDLADGFGYIKPREAIAHQALADAVQQAGEMQSAFQTMFPGRRE